MEIHTSINEGNAGLERQPKWWARGFSDRDGCIREA
jgi:hypothetical protein